MYTMSTARIIADWIKAKNRAKKRDPITCTMCHASFTRIYLEKLERRQYTNTCSIECTKAYQKTIGSKALKRLWTDRDKMVELSSKAGRASATKTVRRSADEIQLYILCAEYFIEVHANKVISDGWDADIVIEDHKLAILWNGPWHYKQMSHKNHSLAQVQKLDEIKKSRLTDADYNVLIYEDRLYTPETAFTSIKEFIAR